MWEQAQAQAAACWRGKPRRSWQGRDSALMPFAAWGRHACDVANAPPASGQTEQQPALPSHGLQIMCRTCICRKSQFSIILTIGSPFSRPCVRVAGGSVGVQLTPTGCLNAGACGLLGCRNAHRFQFLPAALTALCSLTPAHAQFLVKYPQAHLAQDVVDLHNLHELHGDVVLVAARPRVHLHAAAGWGHGATGQGCTERGAGSRCAGEQVCRGASAHCHGATARTLALWSHVFYTQLLHTACPDPMRGRASHAQGEAPTWVGCRRAARAGAS